jgi:hypothetical protein
MIKINLSSNKTIIIISFIIFIVLLGLSIYFRRDEFASAFSTQGICVAVAVILECILTFVLWKLSPIKKIFGEGKGVKRRTLHYWINSFVVIIFLLPFTFLFFNGFLLQENQISTIAQISVIGISITLSGVLLSTIRISQITPLKRQELLCISQKFIMVAILSIFSAASLLLIDKGLNGIDIYTFLPNDITNLYRGFLFWFTTPCFYGSLILFIIGLVDTIFVFFDLDTRPTIPRE